ncbi:sister chromatid cohesion protein DCC1 isoform X1 [Hylaeus volcanicus]|uniref:sister chromatid cohesion protein DCC1 isoform X1 n=1 Tax=Hylaeus volcanicus TaxID=313075 RepID=UPI0023B7829C|nr:sister chromatid cohesion protein DCC1 isoform X1 [Hylaeus volcanicus]
MTNTENTVYSHGINEINETLRLAAIKEANLQNVTHILYSASEPNSEMHTKLLELDEHLLETIKQGDSLMFQGNKQDSAVLCTKSRTYDIKEAETSNSCMLVPNLNVSNQASTCTNGRIIRTHNISGVFHTYYEVKEYKPKLEKLLNILEPTSFKGMEYESAIVKEHLYDWDRLQSEIQASEDELYQALNEYLIVNIDGIFLFCFLFWGYYRLISFEGEVQSLMLMLDLFDENSWELDRIDKEVTYEALKEFIPRPVFDILFMKYTEATSKSKEDATPFYRFNEEKCCKSLAKILLAASPVTEYKQFMESWKIGTPDKMQPKEEYLSGIALITWNSSTLEKEVTSFSEADLPKNINERFNELFKAKNKWTVQEITPYIINLSTTKMNVNALLTKYARCSQVNGIKYYSAKHGK